MINPTKEPEPESLQTGVLELPGEPAIVINGVPDINKSDGSLVVSSTANDTESQRNTSPDTEILGNASFGEWLEGREVQKWFGEKMYTGTVTEFDKETGWYRVVYEDGDFEDLEWQELEGFLVPLDITIPLKSLALKIIKKSQKSTEKSGKSEIRPKTGKAKSLANKGPENGGT
ncbi:dirigent protein 17 [Ricinus communis]|uniref:PTM/DIR17-like Tudor domain-containing protein n=1 Tax=Ricinus communis TaxID=3988 RepID=B9SGU3_RICCO|nr:dirigent protein 17 [Ricinus communis]XP_015578455.1 dirigent protein 17 [Ricinus communis]XP_015578457.1 dirigent protein 17 [Ricinus communis]EEF37178.1 conserved hypothetical protein [Ricinus communis]|eukprot:XP_002525212.1 dirigent protein 17 [Ricinus communis]